MNKIIRKENYNYINKNLQEFKATLKLSVDNDIIEITKALLNEKIIALFPELSPEELEFVDITRLTTLEQIDRYLTECNDYVKGMTKVDNTKLKKLFKKEKKLRLPKDTAWDDELVYLGWYNEGAKRLYVVYELDGQLLGMACQVLPNQAGSTRACKFCNKPGNQYEVAFVSPVCKGKSSSDYRSIGFSMCLDSKSCNERMTSVEHLESVLKDVNGIN